MEFYDVPSRCPGVLLEVRKCHCRGWLWSWQSSSLLREGTQRAQSGGSAQHCQHGTEPPSIHHRACVPLPACSLQWIQESWGKERNNPVNVTVLSWGHYGTGVVWWTFLGIVYLVSSILQEEDFDYTVM